MRNPGSGSDGPERDNLGRGNGGAGHYEPSGEGYCEGEGGGQGRGVDPYNKSSRFKHETTVG